ncbi:MAG: hypothetical protein IJI73_09285, partial [Kiritimatiellae bacterium]|nr:hypothetical protein [Kiritimatiellia bacterium]
VSARSKGYSGKGKAGGGGGAGGSGGASGSNGRAYLAPGASFSGTGNFLSADTHPAIEYTLTFDDEWRTNEVHDVKLGYALPASAPVMSRGSYRFLGWFDRQNALGTKYYNADGTLANPQFPWYSVVGNLKLYAGWQLESGTQPSITVTVAGVTNAITGGVSMSDPNGNFSYDGTTGVLALSKASATYEISGSETNGEIRIVAEQNCMVILNSFSLDGSMQPNVIPLTVSAGRTVTLDVDSGAQLKARDGCPAVSLGQGANLGIAGDGVINLAGGAGAADIALADGASSASVWINTRGPDIHFGTGVLGVQPAFFSANGSGTRVWRVKVPVGGTPRAAVSWAGLPDAYSPQNTIAGAGGESYLWLPDGAYTFSSLTSVGAKEWVVRVNGAHREAIPFVTTGLTINEVDTGHAAGPGWYWDEDHTVFLTNAGPFTVSGSTTAGVGVTASNDCAVTLADLSIDFSAYPGVHAIRVAPGASVDFTLVGDSTLQTATGESNEGRAALSVPAGASAAIDGEGTLTATAGSSQEASSGGAGIGGDFGEDAGSIAIRGGTITSKCYFSGAGIGGGDRGSGGDITISGGIVSAQGRQSGIGGGYGADGGNITISGGTVYAYATLGDRPDIGGMSNPEQASCTITGGSIHTYKPNSLKPAATNAVGATVHCVTVSGLPADTAPEITWLTSADAGYGQHDMRTDSDGRLYVWLANGTHYFTVDGLGFRATVDGTDTDAVPWSSGVTIDGTDVYLGSGDGWSYKDFTLSVTNADLHIGGTNVPHVVSGTNTAAEVRVSVACGGGLAVSNLVLDVSSGSGSPIAIDTGDAVTLHLAGTNALTGAGNYAGVSVAANKTLVIDGDGSLTATGGSQAAGIGGSLREAGGTIVISNGTVTAAGGYRAAGIGGGFNGSAGVCTIAGGTVTATGGEGGAGIGGGYAVFGSDGGHGGTTVISGGRVFATGGSQAAGIGGGRGGSNSEVCVTGGTVVPRHGAEAKYDVGSGYDTSYLPWKVKFMGGSVSTFSTNVTERPVNAGGTRVWRVEVGGLAPGGKVTGFASIAGAPDLSGYGANDIWADDDGKVYLWLPDGNHNFTLAVDGGDAVEYVARVVGADTTACVFGQTGLTVNGRDVGYLGGDGWWCDAMNSVYLTGAGPFTLSGTSEVYGVTALQSCHVTASNLRLHPHDRAAFAVGGNGVGVLLQGAGDGTNTFISGWGCAGIAVCAANNATLTILDGGAPISATSWRSAAGIGGNNGAAAGTINIEGGTVFATGSQGGAGIGGGPGGGAGQITISGGTVEAVSFRDGDQGFDFGAGIGGGSSGSGGYVHINGG